MFTRLSLCESGANQVRVSSTQPPGGTRIPGAAAHAARYNSRRMMPPRAILAAVSFSDSSRVALVLAARLARHCDAELHVLHVEDPLLDAAARYEGINLSTETSAELRRFVAGAWPASQCVGGYLRTAPPATPWPTRGPSLNSWYASWGARSRSRYGSMQAPWRIDWPRPQDLRGIEPRCWCWARRHRVRKVDGPARLSIACCQAGRSRS
jgi:Universal stress protein family